MPELTLAGCAADRLLTYLCALGALRVTGRQADSTVRGCWQDGAFTLETALDRTELEQYYLRSYRPTPLVMPWNSGAFSSGKAGSTAGDALATIASSTSARLAAFRDAIAMTRELLERFERDEPEKDARQRKLLLIRRCRNELPDEVVEWIDAAVVLTTDDVKYPPLLGSGGNDGRLDFTSDYMQRLAEVMPDDVVTRDKRPRGTGASQSAAWLRSALFGEGDVPWREAAVGQFDPGGAGGPNASADFSAGSMVNPWQFILALEGTLLLASAATRRLRAGSGGGFASMPFTVRPVAVGYASAADAEIGAKSRAELWLPLWQRLWTLAETEQVFNEGRLSVRSARGPRQAGNTLDVAQAIAQLGADRGIDAFLRFSFLQRSGNAYFAVCLGQLRTPTTADANVGVLAEISQWHDNLGRDAASGGPGLAVARHQLDEAMFRFAAQSRDDSTALTTLRRAVGHAEQALARYAPAALRKEATARAARPLQGLSGRWISRPPTFAERVALAIAGLGAATLSGGLPTSGGTGRATDEWRLNALPNFREHVEAVTLKGASWAWRKEEDPTVVWGGGNLVANMRAVLERRLIELQMGRRARAAFDGRVHLGTGDVARFLTDHSLDDEIADLVWTFGALSPRGWWEAVRLVEGHSRERSTTLPPNAYVLLKLALLPDVLHHSGSREDPPRSWPVKVEGSSLPVLEPRLPRLLTAGRLPEALELAGRRLRVAGLPPAAVDFIYVDEVQRLEAALLLPLSVTAVKEMEERVLLPEREKNEAQ